MEPSEEIRDAMVRLYEVLNSGDPDAFEALWSRRAGTMALTTDYDEWFVGVREIATVYRVQEEMSRDRQKPNSSPVDPPVAGWRPSDELIALQEGSVGWAVDRLRLRLPMRVTAVFHLERGAWMLVHVHMSIGVSNQDAYGYTAPTTLEEIADDVASERTDVVIATAPNGTVTILFTDIEDSTRHAEALGDRRWMQALREHNAVVRKRLAAEGGFEVKSQGDGFMVAFPSARGALRAAIGIQRAIEAREDALRVRIGLHTGEAIREANDFYGRSVILAARIAAAATGGQILVSSLVRELVAGSDEFTLEEHAEVELKGLAGTHKLWSVRV